MVRVASLFAQVVSLPPLRPAARAGEGEGRGERSRSRHGGYNPRPTPLRGQARRGGLLANPRCRTARNHPPSWNPDASLTLTCGAFCVSVSAWNGWYERTARKTVLRPQNARMPALRRLAGILRTHWSCR